MLFIPLQQLLHSMCTIGTSAQSKRCHESTELEVVQKVTDCYKCHFVFLFCVGTARTWPGEPQEHSAVHRSATQSNPLYLETQIKCTVLFLNINEASYQLLFTQLLFFKQSWLCLWCYATLSKSTCPLSFWDLKVTELELRHLPCSKLVLEIHQGISLKAMNCSSTCPYIFYY